MATESVTRSAHNTLSGTTVDIINLIQPWDQVEISNQGASILTVTLNNVTPIALADNTEIVEAGVTKTFPVSVRGGAVVGSTTSPCHTVQLIGNGNAYSVVGVAGI